MKSRFSVPLLAALLLTSISTAARADEWLDRLDQSMRVSFFKGAVIAQISGLVDMEGYYIEQPALALYKESGNGLFAPRLTMNFDAQITPALYLSAELHVDRGYDPSDRNLEARFDDYSIIYKPWSQIPVQVEAGKFASVVGTYAERYDSWDNPFINAPLPYENLTSIWDEYAVASPGQFHSWRTMTGTRDLAVPIMWGAAYASGFKVSGDVGKLHLAAEVKNASISSRPEYWDFDSHFLEHPTFSAHAAYQPSPTWRFGLSGSVGPYLRPNAELDFAPPGEPLLPDGNTTDDYLETIIAQDITFAWHHWQVWAECFETRFDVPRVGPADTFAYYVEARYQFTPQFSAALRWNQQLFSEVPIAPGLEDQWGNDTSRIDAALTYRWTERLQTKLQYSFTDQNLPARHEEHLVAGQITLRY